jgi:hypothetical protein
MQISQNTIELLHRKLKVGKGALCPNEINDIVEAIVTISKAETTDDILKLSDEKLNELEVFATDKIANLETYKDEKISELETAFENKFSNISASKNEWLNAIAELTFEKQGELQDVGSTIESVNDVPSNSKISAEITKGFDLHSFISGSDQLPFVFGILSRYNDYWGTGNFTTALGTWSSSNAEVMLQLLTGSHGYTTEYAGFYTEPKLCFLQSANGNFIRKKHYTKYTYSTSQYAYPYAALGCLFIKNKTTSSITSTINFGGSSYSGSYGGASVFVGVPNHSGQTMTWTNAYSYTGSSTGFSNSASITIPAKTTVVVLLYTSSYYIASPTNSSSTAYGYHALFLSWYIHSIRSVTMQSGLEIDVEKTVRAWQNPKFVNTYELFK